MRIFKKENCSNKIRSNTFINKFGDKLTLVGRHAYEWQIIIQPTNSSITKCLIFREGRKAAQKEYKKLINQFK